MIWLRLCSFDKREPIELNKPANLAGVCKEESPGAANCHQYQVAEQFGKVRSTM